MVANNGVPTSSLKMRRVLDQRQLDVVARAAFNIKQMKTPELLGALGLSGVPKRCLKLKVHCASAPDPFMALEDIVMDANMQMALRAIEMPWDDRPDSPPHTIQVSVKICAVLPPP